MSRTAAARTVRAIPAHRALVPVATLASTTGRDTAGRDAVVAKLAEGLGFETLARRHRDHLNQHYVDVSDVKAALEAAYHAGTDAAKRG